MSLARSASGPAGLTINTGAANSLSKPGGLFGSTPAATTTAPATSGATTTTTTAGNMFGAAAQSSTGASSLFGAAKPASATGASSLFGGGAAANTTNAPSSGTGASSLFGGGAAANTSSTTPAAGGGLFGQSAAPATQQPAASTGGGGLFGGGAAAAPQQQNTTTGAGGLFGGGASTTTNQAPAAGGGGLFGQSQAKPGGLFGASTTQSTTTQNAQQQPQQQQSQVAAVQVNYDNLRPRSRFDDLAKPLQDEIALIDKGIARVIKMKDEIGEFMPKHETDIQQLGRDVGFVESKFRAVQTALNRDIQTVKALGDLTKKNIADAQLSFKATDNLKLPSHYHQTGLFAAGDGAGSSSAGATAGAGSTHADAQDLITYFNRICDDVERYKKRLDEYRDEIERDMPGVENGLYEQIRALRDRHLGSRGVNGDSVSDQLGQVLLALREMGGAIITQAGQIADTRERLSRLQAGFINGGIYTAAG